MDNFYEQLVKTQKTPKYKFLTGVVYVFGVLALLLIAALRIVPFIIFGAIAGAAYYFKRKAYVEYEYVFTNGDIDIDAIYEMKRRKRVASFNVKAIELLAPADSYHVKDFSGKPEKELNCVPEGNEAVVYTAMVTGGNERMLLNFLPNDNFIELCSKYIPRAVKKD